MDQGIAALAGRVAVVLLAAGRATRFGAPKLRVELGGRPLVHHAAKTLSDMPFAYRLCVATQGGVDLSSFGFDMVEVEPGLPMSRSLAAGVAAASALDVDAVLVALGDMPLVSRGHFESLLAAFNGSVIGSGSAGKAMPPAIFGRICFARLLALEGDGGARELLAGAVLVEAPAGELIDVDTPDDLLAAQALGGPSAG